jgi:hypothetical protein
MENTELASWDIIEHSWHKTAYGGEICEFCGSNVGIGMGSDFVWKCKPRFDEKKFQNWLNFKNFSKYEIRLKKRYIHYSKIERYIKRFSNDEILTRTQLVKQYKKLMQKNE